MRTLFNLKKNVSYKEFEDMLGVYGISYVQRFMIYRNDIVRCYIVDTHDYRTVVVSNDWTDSRDTWFEVTACNKQYITECKWAANPHSLGSMCQVTGDEAMAHVFDFGSSFNNWYLIDTDTGMHWIADNRNPNRVGNHTSEGLADNGIYPVDPNCPRTVYAD